MAIAWITVEDLPDDLQSDPLADQMAESASWILYKLTAEKYRGIREITEWYGNDASNCSACVEDLTDHVHRELLGLTGNESRSIRLRLRGGPVIAVSEVLQGGVELPEDSYLIGNAAYILRSDKSCWNLEDGVLVTYRYGNSPPEAGRQAAITLAIELLKYANGDASCAFPSGVTSVGRQGVDYAIIDPKDFISEGKTGLQSVDLFIQAANPSRAVKKPRIFSINKPRGESYR